ncbi:MAG TPA: M14 metallopeptidase family protein [Pyrinomonadaceae bacterium]|nr:M14 metallopeptidase family protein [Pyrinomonadaceae bacterium]
MAGHQTVFFTRLLSLIVLFGVLFFPTLAQRRTPLSASSHLPSPGAVLGFTPGDDRKIADWAQITDYFSRLDKASDRVRVRSLGQSTLKRPLIAAFISAPENLVELERYRQIQTRLADPRLITSTVERDRLLHAGKLVVAISCSIHSTEIVASQMSMQLAYELASATDPDTQETLNNTILILIPSPNPDGIDIVADWYRKTLGTPHEGSSPPQLYHHYAGHDDNRDWFMLNLVETKAFTQLFWKEWFPQVVYDIHQQSPNGSRFFVPPFYDPPNPRVAPLLLRQVGLFGHKIATDLQAAGFKGVITNSTYDTWWHGGFRTAPYYHNSIGILSEAASARLMTPTTVKREQLQRSTARGMRNALEAATNFPDPWPGGEWRPRDIINMEMSAARSVLQLGAKYRRQLLRAFHDLNQLSITKGSNNEPVAYLIPAGQARDEAVAKLVETLVDQGIEVFRLESELHAAFGPQALQRTNSSAEKLGTYRRIIGHTSGFHEVPAGSYIIFTAQPQRANVLTLLEPQIYPNRVIAGEVERPYDVTGWTLSMQMGVDVPAVMEIRESPNERRLTPITNRAQVRKDLALPLEEIQSPVNQRARIGIYRGWTSNMDEGWTRFVFDTFNVPYKSVSDVEIRQGNLSSKYSVLIFASQRPREILEGNAPGSYPAEYTGGITETGVANLRRFAENGGTVICFDGSCDLLIKQFRLPIANALENERPADFYCPGSVLSLEINRSSMLTRGVPQTLDAYFINSSAFEAIDPDIRIAARYARENVLRSGWLLGEQKLRDKIALAEVAVGQGRVVLFGFRPQHRGQTWGTLQLIWNAINSSSN